MIKELRTIEWSDGKIRIINQNKLPHKLEYIILKTYKEVIKAIRQMKIRGAPAIGVAAAYGLVLGARQIRVKSSQDFIRKLKAVGKEFKASRPTARSISWAVDGLLRLVEENRRLSIPALKRELLTEAIEIAKEDILINQKIGEIGAKLIKKGATILTHCNAGALATVSFGTALGIIRTAHRQEKKIKVLVTETRPRLQGARLTAWELRRERIPVTLITDTMVGHFMKKGLIDMVMVGADRIAKNGDVANKIGTYNIAVLAREHRIPFYVAAPYVTIDPKIKSGNKIPIEERDPKEVTSIGKERIAPKGVKVLNPAFDITPSELIKGIITEKGIIKWPKRKK